MARRNRATDIDKAVGSQIRNRRIQLGLTQQQFAQLIGVTYQQAHKYEKGINRVSAGRLYDIGQALGVPVDYFYLTVTEKPRQLTGLERLQLELARNFLKLSPAHQSAVSILVNNLTK
jgi:transcriptional regulator with XRE-family HTH domain